jgi:hypothetical protein
MILSGYLPLLPMIRLVQCLKQFGAGRLKAPDHDLTHSFEKFVTKSEIFVAVLSKNCLIKKNRGRRLGSSRIVKPKIRREKP